MGFENLPIDKMPKRTEIKAGDYEGKLRRPGEKLLESSTTQDGFQPETSSASKESEKGEK